MHPGSISDEDSECVEAVVNGGEKKGVPSLVDGLVWIHASIKEILGESRLVGWWSFGDYNLEKGLPDLVDGVHIESVSQEHVKDGAEVFERCGGEYDVTK